MRLPITTDLHQLTLIYVLLKMYSAPCVFSAVALLLAKVSAQSGTFRGSSFGVPGVNASFDYVVVGGGTAGLALASRLAENSAITVAVIEAGGFYEEDNGDINVIPGQASYYSGWFPNNTQPLIDWGFVTEPQAACSPDLLNYRH